MAKVDITGLLTGLAGTPDLEREGIKRASAIQGQGVGSNLARSLALRAPQREQMMRQGAGGLFGVDTRTAGQQVQEQLGQLDTSTPEGQKQAVQLIAQVDPTRALALQTQFAEQARVRDLEERTTRAGEIKAISSNAGSPFQFGSSKTYKDSAGNLFLGTQRRDPDSGEVQTKLSPVGNAPSEPDGDIEEVGAYGETSSEALKREVSTAEQESSALKFIERKDVARDDLRSAGESLLKSNKMLNILDTISTGGFAAVGAAAVTDALGVTPASVGEFENLAKQQMVAMLGVFGSNPTEGERKAASELVASINKTEGINRKIIENFRDEMQRRASRAQYLLTPTASSAGYDGYLLSQYAQQTKTGKVINWKDL